MTLCPNPNTTLILEKGSGLPTPTPPPRAKRATPRIGKVTGHCTHFKQSTIFQLLNTARFPRLPTYHEDSGALYFAQHVAKTLQARTVVLSVRRTLEIPSIFTQKQYFLPVLATKAPNLEPL